jgi:hypothetical protein
MNGFTFDLFNLLAETNPSAFNRGEGDGGRRLPLRLLLALWRCNMKQRIVLSAAVLLVTLSLAACNLPSQTQGPTTLIDQPLDSVHVPLAPLTIQAHASDADGVATIEFYISESLLAAVPAGGGSLGNASIE